MEAPACPNCRVGLSQHVLAGLYGRSVEVDLCLTCQGIWFDERENLQLSARSTIELFRLIHERPSPGRRPLAERLECPRCTLRLSLVGDQQRQTRFQYHRCPRGHGRFITFFHFLRSRNFVRTLTPREIADLRARVTQVNCSNCGGALNLDNDVACSYCRAPISMLDPEQVAATLGELQAVDARHQRAATHLPIALLAERTATEHAFAEAARVGSTSDPVWTFSSLSGAGLVEAGLDRLLQWWAVKAG